jgi:hypothetical protein
MSNTENTRARVRLTSPEKIIAWSKAVLTAVRTIISIISAVKHSPLGPLIFPAAH